MPLTEDDFARLFDSEPNDPTTIILQIAPRVAAYYDAIRPPDADMHWFERLEQKLDRREPLDEGDLDTLLHLKRLAGHWQTEFRREDTGYQELAHFIQAINQLTGGSGSSP